MKYAMTAKPEEEKVEEKFPFVSIIIPCRDEEKYISGCLESILDNDYPKESLEIIVVDGMSEDRTREIIKRFIGENPIIKLLDNRKKITSWGLNIGIKDAKGELIIIMGTHTIYDKKYISSCVKNIRGADCIGGACVSQPGSNSYIAEAIAFA